MLQSLGAARQPAPKALVAFGFPNYSGTRSTASTDNASLTALPNTREEVIGIGGLYPASQRALHLAGAATEATAKSDAIAQYRYVHFAVHGLVDEAAPAKSGLALSPGGGTDDGVLRMDEIAKLRLNADLVTLSACRTGVGKFLQGEGLMALSRAFFYAGAQKVVASLWDVNDASTSQLMRSFYAQLKAGRAPAQALQAAKLSMLRGSQRLWRHPHYWSPFVALQ
jgi:CHAT domain-containing protein